MESKIIIDLEQCKPWLTVKISTPSAPPWFVYVSKPGDQLLIFDDIDKALASVKRFITAHSECPERNTCGPIIALDMPPKETGADN